MYPLLPGCVPPKSGFFTVHLRHHTPPSLAPRKTLYSRELRVVCRMVALRIRNWCPSRGRWGKEESGTRDSIHIASNRARQPISPLVGTEWPEVCRIMGPGYARRCVSKIICAGCLVARGGCVGGIARNEHRTSGSCLVGKRLRTSPLERPPKARRLPGSGSVRRCVREGVSRTPVTFRRVVRTHILILYHVSRGGYA